MSVENPGIGTLSRESELTLPLYNSPLVNQQLALSRNGLRSDADNIELAALCHLLALHSITAFQVWEMIKEYFFLPDYADFEHMFSEDEEWALKSHRVILEKVWSSLTMLIIGDPLNPALEVSDVQRARDWCTDTLRRLRRVLPDNRLEADDFVELLPDALKERVAYRHGMEWYASPLTLGAALYWLPISQGRSFGDRNGPALLGVLLHDVQIALTECHGAYYSSEKGDAYGRLSFHWFKLKGFVHAMVSDKSDSALINQVPRNSVLYHEIVRALVGGMRDLDRATGPITPVWDGHGGAEHDKIDNTDISDLLKDFTVRVQSYVSRPAPR